MSSSSGFQSGSSIGSPFTSFFTLVPFSFLVSHGIRLTLSPYCAMLARSFTVSTKNSWGHGSLAAFVARFTYTTFTMSVLSSSTSTSLTSFLYVNLCVEVAGFSHIFSHQSGPINRLHPVMSDILSRCCSAVEKSGIV